MVTDDHLITAYNDICLHYRKWYDDIAADFRQVAADERQGLETFYDKHFRVMVADQRMASNAQAWIDFFRTTGFTSVNDISRIGEERGKENPLVSEAYHNYVKFEQSFEQLLRDIDERLNEEYDKEDVHSMSLADISVFHSQANAMTSLDDVIKREPPLNDKQFTMLIQLRFFG